MAKKTKMLLDKVLWWCM